MAKKSAIAKAKRKAKFNVRHKKIVAIFAGVLVHTSVNSICVVFASESLLYKVKYPV